jgi:capsular exopolysaccharide synthesis family protein
MAQEEIGLQQYIEVLWRRRWVILSVFIVVFAISAVWISMSKTTYEVQSLVGIKNPLYNRQILLPFASGTERPDQSLSGESQVKVINGLPFSEQVANTLARLPEPLAAEPREVYASLSAQYEEPDLIIIKVRHLDPDRAVVMANTAADTFVEDRLQNQKADIVSYAEHAQAEMEQARTELVAAETEIARFKEGLGFVNINDEINTLKTTIGGFEKEAASVQTQIEIAEAHREEIRKLAAISGVGDTSVLVDEPQVEELRTLQGLLTQARLRYTNRHPIVINLESQIREIEGKLRASLEATGSSISPERYLSLRGEITQVDADLANLKTARDSWRRQIALVREQLTGFPEKQYRLEALEAKADEARQRYISFREKVDEANSKAITIQGPASVIDYARSARPSMPKSTSLALAFIVNTLLALGAGFVVEFADSTVRTPEEVTRVAALAFLGSVIRMKEPRQVVWENGQGINNSSEAYTRVYSNIKFAAVEAPLRSILITSARKGEGKSTSLINLGCAIAAAGKRIIVVDTDLRNPTLQRILKTKHPLGVTSVLAGECMVDEALQATAHPGMFILPSGPIPPNPSELIQSSAMKQLIEDLEARCDMVLFDSPPGLLVADAMLLGSELDAAVLVSESGAVTRKELQLIRDTLQVAKARILGVILNKVVETPGASYYNYYSYYRYYKDPEEEKAAPAGALGWLKESAKSIGSRMGGRT